jgi:ornithine--oxo-acid transaminase
MLHTRDSGVTGQSQSPETTEAIALVEQFTAHNYHPLPVVAASGDGAFITAVDGRRYLDCLAAYSAVNFGHSNPRLVAAAKQQLGKITLTSRAFHNDQLGGFAEELTRLAGKDLMLPMNSGAEAVETAIKLARKWGYQVKGVRANRAEIIVAGNNFHGRTTTIVSFSTDADSRRDFGPFTPGFRVVAHGDVRALRRAMNRNTVAVLLEPIQGEAGVIMPPDGYLQEVRELCTQKNVLMIADEIQSGLGRTGYTFSCEHWGVVPDMYVLGKALGGGILPVSAVVGDRAVLGLLKPGEHGSTFGGNPLASAIGREVVAILQSGEFQERSKRLGARLHAGLDSILRDGVGVVAVRGLGLWAGVDIDPNVATAREVCLRLLERGILAKDTHGQTIRIAPPLVITESDVDFLLQQLREVLVSP